MKRIVDGATYNTATSMRIALWRHDDEQAGEEKEGTLYQTRGGAFFVHWTTTKSWYDRSEGEQKTKRTDHFEVMTRSEAEDWIADGDNEIFHNPFGDPPEAEATVDGVATVYTRVPPSLKAAIELDAAERQLSLNAWAIGAFEAKAGRTRDKIIEHLGGMWGLASNSTYDADAFSRDEYREMLGMIRDGLELVCETLGFEEQQMIDGWTTIGSAAAAGGESARLYTRFQPYGQA